MVQSQFHQHTWLPFQNQQRHLFSAKHHSLVIQWLTGIWYKARNSSDITTLPGKDCAPHTIAVKVGECYSRCIKCYLWERINWCDISKSWHLGWNNMWLFRRFVEWWKDSAQQLIPLNNNWGSESIFVTKGTVVGQIEGAELVKGS